MWYPVRFHPIYKEMIWGGDRMARLYGRVLPYEKTGESWDISARPAEMGVIENGPDAGRTFAEWIARDPLGVLGRRAAAMKRFPLLVKIIDAGQNLSVQVHPDDAYAEAQNLDDGGKSEMWCVLEPPEDGRLIVGLRDGVTRDGLASAAQTGRVEDCLNFLPVNRGDIVNIPAGLVHALTRGAVVAEVQQNSDITYRLFDYNRVGQDGRPRALHIADALAVTDFDCRIPRAAVRGLTVHHGGARLTYAVANRYFAAIHCELDGTWEESGNPQTFALFTCLEGTVAVEGGACAADLPVGRTVMIPAGLSAYRIMGRGKLLKSFVPDIDADFVQPLRAAGYTVEEIRAHTAV